MRGLEQRTARNRPQLDSCYLLVWWWFVSLLSLLIRLSLDQQTCALTSSHIQEWVPNERSAVNVRSQLSSQALTTRTPLHKRSASITKAVSQPSTLPRDVSCPPSSHRSLTTSAARARPLNLAPLLPRPGSSAPIRPPPSEQPPQPTRRSYCPGSAHSAQRRAGLSEKTSGLSCRWGRKELDGGRVSDCKVGVAARGLLGAPRRGL